MKIFNSSIHPKQISSTHSGLAVHRVNLSEVDDGSRDIALLSFGCQPELSPMFGKQIVPPKVAFNPTSNILHQAPRLELASTTPDYLDSIHNHQDPIPFDFSLSVAASFGPEPIPRHPHGQSSPPTTAHSSRNTIRNITTTSGHHTGNRLANCGDRCFYRVW
jgi:hypothetical protein